MSPKFGDYLRKARQEAGIRTQHQAAKELERLGRRVSQGLIAQYETGKIKSPDPNVLCLLAKLYKKDYLELIFHLVKDKYSLCDPESAEVTNARWSLWEAALQRFKSVGGVPGLEVYQLRAKTSLLQQEILTAEGLSIWERNYKDLEVVWIVASNVLNDKSSRILDSVIQNMKQGVQMVYFVRGEDIQRGGRFWQLQRTLLTRVQSSELTKGELKPPVAVGLGESELGWLNTDLIIANPHWQDHAAGFKYIRRGRGGPSYAIRITPFELGDMIRVLRTYAANHVPEEEFERVLPFKASQELSNPKQEDPDSALVH